MLLLLAPIIAVGIAMLNRYSMKIVALWLLTSIAVLLAFVIAWRWHWGVWLQPDPLMPIALSVTVIIAIAIGFAIELEIVPRKLKETVRRDVEADCGARLSAALRRCQELEDHLNALRSAANGKQSPPEASS